MGTDTARHHLGTQRPLAAGFDLAPGRLREDREVGGEQLGSLARDPAEPVVDVLDLLTLVEHEGDVSPGVGGATREIFWSTATTFAATPRVTVVGEVMGRRLSELSLVQDVYEPHLLIAGVETMRWLPNEPGVHTMFVVTGAKWNLASSWLLNTNLLIRVTDAGLRARVTPAISLDYAFER